MLSTQLNYLIEENTLGLNAICVLKRHVTNILKDGRFVKVFFVCYLEIIDFITSESCSHWHFVTGKW